MSTVQTSDVLIIGAGHNGLIAAAYLALAGYSVRILEGQDRPGGAAVTEEFAPDYYLSTCAHLLDGWSRQIEKDLKLHKLDFEMAARTTMTTVLDRDGRHLVLPAQKREDIQLLAEHSSADAQAYPAFRDRMNRFAATLGPLLTQSVPAFGAENDSAASRKLASSLAWRVQKMSNADRHDWLHFQGNSIANELDRSFESDLIKGAIAFDATFSHAMGASTPGSAFALAYKGAVRHNSKGEMGNPAGGMGAFTDALIEAASQHGAELHTNCRVTKLLVDDERIAGAELSDGTRYEAKVVLSSASARTTYVDMLGPTHVQPAMQRRLTRIRKTGTVAKLHLALEGLPHIENCAEREYGGRMIISPSVTHVDQAFAACKRGHIPDEPVMEVFLPSFHDYRLAPPGHHVMSIIVPFIPYEVEGGWEAQEEVFTKRIVDIVSTYATDLKLKIIAGDTLTPPKIEKQFGLGEGGWHQGDMSFDQAFAFRPAPGLAHQAPVEGLFLCGAAAHPGGGMTGLPGKLAAEQALSFLKREGKDV